MRLMASRAAAGDADFAVFLAPNEQILKAAPGHGVALAKADVAAAVQTGIGCMYHIQPVAGCGEAVAGAGRRRARRARPIHDEAAGGQLKLLERADVFVPPGIHRAAAEQSAAQRLDAEAALTKCKNIPVIHIKISQTTVALVSRADEWYNSIDLPLGVR